MLDCVFVYMLHTDKDLHWHQRIHSHGPMQFELHYFISGSGVFHTGNRKYTITPGSLFITPEMTTHAIETSKDENLTYFATLMKRDENQADLIKGLNERNPIQKNGNLRFVFENIRDRALTNNEALMQSACYEVISLLYSIYGGCLKSKKEEENVYIKQSLVYMQEHVFSQLCLNDIAKTINLNSSYFVRLFKKTMGTSPIDYFTRLQMEAARSFLENTTLSIKEIAGRLQYCSEFHFSKRFKDITGYSPSEYRKTHVIVIPGTNQGVEEKSKLVFK